MNIVFMGTPDFSVGPLQALTAAGHQVLAAVTQPDKPKGRGKAVVMTPVKEAALALGIPVFQPVKVKDEAFLDQLLALQPDIIVVVAFGQILPKALLDIPPFGCVNIHASLLPKYRGAAPIQWAIIDGEPETGITTMQMDTGLDTGDILEISRVPIGPAETGGSLHEKLSQAGSQLILSTLEKLQQGTIKPIPQPESGSSYAKMLTKSMGDIDWSQEAVKIERLIRGLNPWPSAYTILNGKTLKIWSAKVIDEDLPGVPGEVVLADKRRLYVKTGKGVLSLTCVQPEGKKRMEAEAFLRGYPVSAGLMLRQKQQQKGEDVK